MTTAIKLTKICKEFNQHPVLKNIDLEIKKGEIIGLLGPNGAGKSTLIKIMTGLLLPDNGEVEILEKSLLKNKHRLRKYLGIAPQELGIYPQLTIKQNLQNFGAINGLSSAQIKEKYLYVSSIFNLNDLKNKKAADLSGGQKRRLHSAIALMSHAKVIFLDEPTVGADVNSRNQIIHAIKMLSKQGMTFIYTTHYLQEMEALNAKIIFLNNGAIQATGSLEEILQIYARPSLELYFEKAMPSLKGWKKEDNHLKLTNLNSNKQCITILKELLNNPQINQTPLMNIKIIKADLESAYQTLLEKSISNEN
ncbi:ABC transporter ATP-binding protein [Liquorilactobacillus hordei]|uniref:ABC transporter ATP-binding protein n=1 Tax=Liquorilactobacillus hordei TaxID=468911 RepID=UPI001CBE9086|nr:ABC transporter ATP-binding protein [Liquorilactobacillus hordei]MBZ2405033.1 dipeptide/oligopeptide/nickel ABC transporter ATP-binding protein [Liquorilactobacillus hordei]